jgi:NADH-quinone oxidoreductase subunit I
MEFIAAEGVAVTKQYFRNVYQTLKTILVGMQITMRYAFARTVTVQYPDVPPPMQPRFRGFHWFEIEKCSACKSCARACPVDCITIESSGPRKIDKATGLVRGGAMTKYEIDYSKCMFCGLCCEPCPTECLHMGDMHDNSVYDRPSTIVEFTELAKQGLRTPQPLWMRKASLPDWAKASRDRWLELARPRQEEMAKALIDQTPAKKPAPAASTPDTPGPAGA